MKKQIIYQGKGISKRYTLSMIFLFIALEALGVFFLIQKRYSHVLEKGNNTFSEEGSVYVGQISLKSSYALSSGLTTSNGDNFYFVWYFNYGNNNLFKENKNNII